MALFEKTPLLPLLLVLWCSQGLLLAQESHFDQDNEGWRASGDPVSTIPTWFSTGGNPGGWIRTIDASTGGTWQWVAPAKFLGNKCTAYGNFLRYDITASDFNLNTVRPDITLVSGNLQLVFNTPDDPATTWTHYDILLRENAGWRVGNNNGPVPSQSQFRGALANLTGLIIRGEYLSSGDDIGGLDNVILEGAFAFDLDANDSTTPTGSLDFYPDTLCGGDSPVVDTDVLLVSEVAIDSLIVELLNPQDGAAESLALPAWPQTLTVSGNHSARLVLHNTGNAPAADFQAALLLIRYQNTRRNATRAARVVDCRVYTFCGETGRARAVIPYFPTGFAGSDSSRTFCTYDPGQDLRNLLGDSISTDGRWEPPLPSGTSLFQPDRDPPGDFRYIVESPAGCLPDSALVHLKINYPPEIGPDTVICRDSTLLLAVPSPGNYGSWRWNTGPDRPDIEVAEAGLYVVTVTSVGGTCVYADSVQVALITCSECPVYMPNVFSPNDDGVNDVFQPSNRCVFGHYQLQVFDRWGNMVFYTEDPGTGWDGRFRGNDLLPGVFVWLMRFDAELLGRLDFRTLSGSVTLLR